MCPFCKQVWLYCVMITEFPPLITVICILKLYILKKKHVTCVQHLQFYCKILYPFMNVQNVEFLCNETHLLFFQDFPNRKIIVNLIFLLLKLHSHFQMVYTDLFKVYYQLEIETITVFKKILLEMTTKTWSFSRLISL